MAGKNVFWKDYLSSPGPAIKLSEVGIELWRDRRMRLGPVHKGGAGAGVELGYGGEFGFIQV